MLRSGRFWFALVFAAVLLLPGLYLAGRAVYCLLTYQSTNGTANIEGRSRRRAFTRYAISYPAADGKSYTIRDSGVWWLGMGYDAGERVKVLYPAGNPEAGVIATFFHHWFWPLFGLLTPLIFILPVAGWARKGMEDDRLAALAAEEAVARDRERHGPSRKRLRRDEQY